MEIALSLDDPVANVEASKSPDCSSSGAGCGATGVLLLEIAERLEVVAVWETAGADPADGAAADCVCGCGVDDCVDVAAGAGVVFFTGAFYIKLLVLSYKLIELNIFPLTEIMKIT